REQRQRTNPMEGSRALRLAQAYTPVGEIARIGELAGTLRTPGCKHLAPLRDPARPIRKPIRRVVRAGDEAWSQVRDSPWKRSLERFFGAGFEWTVAMVSFSEVRGL